jgi:hypothetical protein
MPRIHKSLQRPNQILKNPKGALNKIYSQTQDLLKVQSLIQQFIPANVSVASIRDNTLHLITNSSATATQIRYRQRNIITATRRLGVQFDIDHIKVSVRPDEPQSRPPMREPIPPSAKNARQLAATAKYIEDDGLRKALIRLSRRVQ